MAKEMTNTKLLRERIERSGYKYTMLAEKLDLTYQGFLNKIENNREFKASEIEALRILLGLTDEERDEIFFVKK
jgi:hypothetical protein